MNIKASIELGAIIQHKFWLNTPCYTSSSASCGLSRIWLTRPSAVEFIIICFLPINLEELLDSISPLGFLLVLKKLDD